MLHRNFLTQPLEPLEGCHDGAGVLRHREVIGGKDFQADIRFLNYTVLPPGTSIGLHRHGNDQELYIVLSGHGEMELDGETYPAQPGDVFVNEPYGTHGLRNTGGEDLAVLVLESPCPAGEE